MIRPDLIGNKAQERKAFPVLDFSIVAELSALHELSAFAFAETEEALAKEAVEKVTRLFGTRRFAVLSGRGTPQRMIISSGVKKPEEVLSQLIKSDGSAHRLILLFNENTDDQDIIFFEQSRPLDDRTRRLYNVFARRLEDRLAAFRSELRRKQTEDALRQSEARFQRALEHVPDVIIIYNSDLRIQYTNSAITALTGRPVTDFLGKCDTEIWPPEITDTYIPTLRKAFETHSPQTLETGIHLPTKGRKYVKITYAPIVSDDGNSREVVGIMQELKKLPE